MLNLIGRTFFAIAVSLVTEEVFKALIANALEEIAKCTETKIDNNMLAPIIKALRK